MRFSIGRSLAQWFGIPASPGRDRPVKGAQTGVSKKALRVWVGFFPVRGTDLVMPCRASAPTKSEARAAIKRQFGLDRLPVGTSLEELDRRS